MCMITLADPSGQNPYALRLYAEQDLLRADRLARAADAWDRRDWRRRKGYSPAELRYHPEAPKIGDRACMVAQKRLRLAGAHADDPRT